MTLGCVAFSPTTRNPFRLVLQWLCCYAKARVVWHPGLVFGVGFVVETKRSNPDWDYIGRIVLRSRDGCKIRPRLRYVGCYTCSP
jgi:hypothetical protein